MTQRSDFFFKQMWTLNKFTKTLGHLDWKHQDTVAHPRVSVCALCVYLCVREQFCLFHVLHRSEESSTVRVSPSDRAQVTRVYYAWEKGRWCYKKPIVIFTVKHAGTPSVTFPPRFLGNIIKMSTQAHQNKLTPGRVARCTRYRRIGASCS